MTLLLLPILCSFSALVLGNLQECDCSPNFRPVCGSNGVTFRSLCFLQCAARFRRGLRVAYTGACCAKLDCGANNNPICDTLGKTHMNECIFDHVRCLIRKTQKKLVHKNYDGACRDGEGVDCEAVCFGSGPVVCDSRNVTHPSRCALEKMNCLRQKYGKSAVSLMHDGPCREMEVRTTVGMPSWTPEPVTPPEQIAASTTSNDASTVDIDSSGDDDESSDKTTMAALILRDELTGEDEFVEGFDGGYPLGEGGPSDNEDIVAPTDSNSTTTITTTSAAYVSSPPFDLSQPCSATNCEKNWDPVCDSNNKTHRNICLLKFYACKLNRINGTMISLYHQGECSKSFDKGTEACEPCPEKDIFVPLCDNTNNTYRSLCALANFNCKLKNMGMDERVLLHVGKCHARSAQFSLKDEICPSNCGTLEKPVCDEDGTTHRNLCTYQMTSCQLRKSGKRSPSLKYLQECLSDIISTREQSSTTSVSFISEDAEKMLKSIDTGNGTRSVETSAEDFDCPTPTCEKGGLAVCDSEGNLHENTCVFAHARCLRARSGSVLTVQSEEACFGRNCTSDNCTDVEDPVCGSDFNTYTNLCYFNKQRCKEEKLELIFHGKCTECLDSPCTPASDSSDEQFVCDQEGNTRTLCEYQMLACIFERNFGLNISIQHTGRCCTERINCENSTMERLCASDGRSFDNKCELELENCRLGKLQLPTISFAHDGVCQEEEKLLSKDHSKEENPFAAPDSDSIFHDEAQSSAECPKECSKEYIPVCGSNEETYMNVCHLKAARCKNGTAVEVSYHGPCCIFRCSSEFSPVCDDQGTTHQNLCVFAKERCIVERVLGKNITIEKFDVCQDSSMCSKDCTTTFEPICTTEGETIVNQCEMNRRNCFLMNNITTGKMLVKDHDGECCFTDKCDYVFSPVCDSDSITHSNECVFKQQACYDLRKHGRVTTKQYEGQCCNQPCEETYDPVCDGNTTHENLCRFKIAQCEAEKFSKILSVTYNGECCTVPKGTCEKSGAICDSEGETHVNVCRFRQKKCISEKTQKKALSIIHAGECCSLESCGKVVDPVCDSHGGTHLSSCHFSNTKCIHDKMHPNNTITLAYTGACCKDDCKDNWEPVCDQHGNFFKNKCKFQFSACEKLRISNAKLLETPCPERRLRRENHLMNSQSTRLRVH